MALVGERCIRLDVMAVFKHAVTAGWVYDESMMICDKKITNVGFHLGRTSNDQSKSRWAAAGGGFDTIVGGY